MSTINLNGSAWTLSASEKKLKISGVQMNIPGDVHSALLRKGIIQNPYWRFNEKDVQWVGKEKWLISRTFDFRKEEGFRTYLTMSMADTYFTLYINGKTAGRGDNYFRLWRFDITNLLKNGKNTISVEFDSAEKRAIADAKKIPYPVPCSQYDMFSPHRNMSRKIQCHSGWDWGPCIMACGIYGDISLQTVREGYIQSVTMNTSPVVRRKFDGLWNAKTGVRYHSLSDKKMNFKITLKGNGLDFETVIQEDAFEGDNEYTWNLRVENPELWKSADELKDEGLSENSLYTLTVTALNADSEDDDSMEKQIAFRTLSLIAKQDSYGCSLYYELNGRAVFAKGSNWIPADSLPERWTESRYRTLLQSTVDANMNTLRIWGGGNYESDLCYNLCDRLGLIVWQDCAFACSLYPATEEFLSSVEQEIEDNVYRLQHHPSLAVWCGNNEDFGSLTWYEESRKNRDRYIVDYDRLNHGCIEATIKRCDPDHTWWPSSPCAGPGTFGDNWHNDSEGDMHFWSVWHEKKDMEAYLEIKPRFVSEFGYESFPSTEGILEFAEKKDLNLTSPVMEWHQRSPGGNSIILENFSRYFRFPKGTENMIYLSQVQQALAVKTAVDYWRSLRPHCMGAVIWQLNDVWPVASWSSLEYSGKWKLLHYAAKKFFSRVALSLVKKDGVVYLNVVNESLSTVKAEITVRIINFEGKDVAPKIKIPASLKSDTVKCVWTSEFSKLPVKCDSNECFVYAEMKAASIDGRKQNFYMNDTLFFERWKKCEIGIPEITYSIEEKSGGFVISLETDKPAFFTSFDVPGIKGTFSENMITLLPGKKSKVTFTQDSFGSSGKTKPSTLSSFKKALRITTLRDTYE